MSKNGVIVKPKDFNVIGGKKYKTVKMPDGKTWLAENLDFKFCNIGGSGVPSTPNAWYYDNDETTYGWSGYKCGLLYNWYAVKFLNDNRSELCPGWHVSTLKEWLDFVSFIGNSESATKLKAIDGSVVSNFPSGWNGTDNYGLGILPAGYRTNNSIFEQIGTFTSLWTITLKSATEACRVDLASTPIVGNYYADFKYGYSIRLVKDS